MSQSTTSEVVTSSFNDYELGEPLQKAIRELGYTQPTPIQEQTLPILLGEPTDFVGLATTGTGKTAAFALPLLARLAEGIDPDQPLVQAIVLCPTRELALQVTEQITQLGKHLGVRALPVYGGTGYGDQLKGLRKGVSVVVGTPGRIVDHLEKGSLDLTAVETVILDEADEMISMGFKEDLESVLSSVPEGQSNIWLFSATMSPAVRKVADQFLRDPQHVQINRSEMLSENVEQIYYTTSESNKPEVLCKLIDLADDFYGIVFCQTKALVMDLNQYLRSRGYAADCLHGDMDQAARERTMRAFREKRVTLLIATDVACRGLDVKDVSHVINYSIPRELDNYVHRIGRTARSGKSGLALSLVTPSHRGLVSRIERVTRSKMKEGKIPTRRELGAKKLTSALSAFDSDSGHIRALEILSPEWKQKLEGLSKEEIAARFLSMSLPEIFAENRDPEPQARASGRSIPGASEHSGERRVIHVGQRPPQRSGPPPRVMRASPSPAISGDSFESETVRSSEKRPGEAKGFGKKPFGKKPYAKKEFGKKPFEKKPFGKNPFARSPGDQPAPRWGDSKPSKNPYGAKKAGYFKKGAVYHGKANKHHD